MSGNVCSQTNGCCGLREGGGWNFARGVFVPFFQSPLSFVCFVSITHAFNCEGLHLRAHYRIFTGIFRSLVRRFDETMQMHLPLNEIDGKNNPALWFLWIQDGMNLACGVLWSTAYVLYIRQSFRDKSYGMPLLSL